LPALFAAAVRERDLTEAEIRDLLRAGAVQFVVRDPGLPAATIPLEECFAFWKREVQPRIIEAEAFRLEDFPGQYAFAASEWRQAGCVPIVVLDRRH
jgi:hypothetical protein